MAVYTPVPATALAAFLSRYDVDDLVSATGIAEGVENSNYRVATTGGTYLLTLYERRVAAADLPYFLALLDHLAARGCPVPRALPDRAGVQLQELCGRPACLIEFLPGRSPAVPTPTQAHTAGAALARLHLAAADFVEERANDLGPAGWLALFARDPAGIEALVPGFGAAIADVSAAWPVDLPLGTIHADLFPDNVLMQDTQVTGLIDFYFACTDFFAYDLAVMHSAWAFDSDGQPVPDVGDALVGGYAQVRPLGDDERTALPLLAQGACLRFTLTRAWDWLNTPADALVTRKDPLAYWRRFHAYRSGTQTFR